jgi:Na+-transporting methylmalonyl-CoA/oxaloacetate decarboxylase gamma subunit
MKELLARVIAGNDFEKGIFLMVCGLAFVFAVQLIFYFLIKIAGRKKPEKA